MVVSYQKEQGVAVLGMDDGKANALSHGMIDELLAGLDRAEKEARAVLIAGRPGKLCAGFHLPTMMSGIEPARELVAYGAELFLRIYDYPLPVVMACTGHAMAGGAVMLLTGDTRIGAEGDFKIGFNEIAIGMPLPIFVQELARDRLDPRYRLAATIHAQVLSPEGALAAGFLDQVVPAERLLEQAMAEATKLSRLPTQPYALTKQRMRKEIIDYVRATLSEDMVRLTPPQG